MFSLLEMINPDISYLIGLQITYINNKKNMIQELIDKIIFTKHMNYYKRFRSFNNHYLRYMLMNKLDYTKIFNSLKGQYGWICDKKTNNIWKLCDNPKYDNITKKTVKYMDPFNYSHRYIKDKIEGKTIELMFYPPSNRFYNSKDVLKYME